MFKDHEFCHDDHQMVTEVLEGLVHNVENTVLYKEDRFYLLFKEAIFPYNSAFLLSESEDLFCVPSVGITLKRNTSVQIEPILKSTTTWLASNCTNEGANFYQMCEYVLADVTSLSVIGSTKKQKIEFIDALVKHLDPLFLRNKGKISFNRDIEILGLDDNLEPEISDLITSLVILFLAQKRIFGITSWDDLFGRLPENVKTVFNKAHDVYEHCKSFHKLHKDILGSLRFLPIEEWIDSTPNTIDNSVMHYENGRIFLLYKEESITTKNLRKLKNNPLYWVEPKVGFHLKSFNDNLNLSRTLHRIIYCALKQQKLFFGGVIHDIHFHMHDDSDGGPKLPKTFDTVLNNYPNLVDTIIRLLPEIFQISEVKIYNDEALRIELSETVSKWNSRSDGRLIMEICKIQFNAKHELSLAKIFERIPGYFKGEQMDDETVILSEQDLEDFMKKYETIFDVKSLDAKDTLTWEDVKEGLKKLSNEVETIDEHSIETLEVMTKRLERLCEKAKKVCAENRDRQDFQDLAPIDKTLGVLDTLDI